MNKITKQQRQMTDSSALNLLSRPFISVNLKDAIKANKCFNCINCSKMEDCSASFSYDLFSKASNYHSQNMKAKQKHIKKRVRAETEGDQHKCRSRKQSLKESKQSSKLITNRSTSKIKSKKSAVSKKKALKCLTETEEAEKFSAAKFYKNQPDSSDSLVAQNLSLLKINQHLLYQRQYYKQKNTLQEVICRDLQRKLKQAEVKIRNIEQQSQIKDKACRHDKSLNKIYAKSSLPEQKSKEELKERQGQRMLLDLKNTYNQTESYYTKISKNVSSLKPYQKENKEKVNINNYITQKSNYSLNTHSLEQEQDNKQNFQRKQQGTVRKPTSNTSSLLLSVSRPPLQQTKSKKGANLVILENNKNNKRCEGEQWREKMEDQFSELLESVQNQTNVGRKMTLRKMLANKAMELKRLKGKS